jgi:hypothetical protein
MEYHMLYMESRKKLGYGRLKNLLKKTMKVCFVVGRTHSEIGIRLVS